jgi:LysR family transcriptional regulator, low CO2-responsive transcriptional regulator
LTNPRNPMRRYFRHGLLPQLVAFEACVRLGSVTRAAEELCLAQPTVSCMLRKLADAFGGPLTIVTQRRVRPTDLGLKVLELSDDLIDAFERFDETASFSSTSRRAWSRPGFGPSRCR